MVLPLAGFAPSTTGRFSGVHRGLTARGLTPREADILRWVTTGKTNPEIAIILGLSPRTVQHTLERIYRKLGVETRTAATAWALQATADPE